jgi:hypothetical protein
MFEALGESVMWLCLLDDLLRRSRPTYANDRDNDPQGGLLPGLRHARDSLVHGRTVVHVADPTALPKARVVQAVRRGGPQIIVPPTCVAWTFDPNLPRLAVRQQKNQRAIDQQRVYNTDLVGQQREAISAVQDAVDWLDRMLSTP